MAIDTILEVEPQPREKKISTVHSYSYNYCMFNLVY